ncbi:MAG: nuclear transport factor 2 family protein [Firmicutes bacterium]|nr:nuclear transport factor 2 family protein [Bacillota bacterium]
MITEVLEGATVTYPKDCGNAPKKSILAGFYRAFAQGDWDYIKEHTVEALSWNIIGDKIINSQEETLALCREHFSRGVREVQISNVITHGNVAAVNGSVAFGDDKGYSFCDIYKFNSFGKNAKVKEITSYVI